MTEPLTPSNVPAPETGPHLTCPSCGRTLRNDLPLDCPFCGASDPSRSPIPWEDPRPIGFPARFFPTLRQVLFHPRQFFSRLDPLGRYRPPLLFALIVLAPLAFVFLLACLEENVTYPWCFGPQPFQSIYRFYTAGLLALALLPFAYPAAFLGGFFLAAGLLHGCLRIILRERRSFRVTCRVLGYSAAPWVFFLVLFIPGTVMAMVWGYLCLVTGLTQAHHIPRRQAHLAVLLIPIVIASSVLFLLLLSLLITVLGYFLSLPSQQIPY